MDINMATIGDPFTPNTSTGKDLKNEEVLAVLGASLDQISTDQFWQHQMNTAKNDESRLSALLARVLRDVTDILAKSKWAGDFISRQNIDDAEMIVKNFTKMDFREWEDAVREGVKHGDWEGIFRHSMHNPSNAIT